MSIERLVIRNSDDLIQCPYDKSHMIREKRMVYHLKACRANHPTVQLVPCWFNAKHLVPPTELRYHMAHCDDKARIEGNILYEEQNIVKGYTDVPEYNQVIVVPSDEDWDCELDAMKRAIQSDTSPPQFSIERHYISLSKTESKIASLDDDQNARVNGDVISESDVSCKTHLAEAQPEPTVASIQPPSRPGLMGGVRLPLAGVGRGILVNKLGNNQGNDTQMTVKSIGRGRSGKPL